MCPRFGIKRMPRLLTARDWLTPPNFGPHHRKCCGFIIYIYFTYLTKYLPTNISIYLWRIRSADLILQTKLFLVHSPIVDAILLHDEMIFDVGQVWNGTIGTATFAWNARTIRLCREAGTVEEDHSPFSIIIKIFQNQYTSNSKVRISGVRIWRTIMNKEHFTCFQ